jgi:hypothetical protein
MTREHSSFLMEVKQKDQVGIRIPFYPQKVIIHSLSH